jgi:Tfp pilus assembly protein FimT
MPAAGILGRRPASARAAFSLVELMGVAVVLGLIATMAFVSWESVLPRTKLNSAVRELAATLSEARSEAIARNAHFAVEYYFEATDDHPVGFRVVTPFRKGGGLATYDDERVTLSWHALPQTVTFDKIVINGEEVTSGRAVVGFTPLGAASDHTVVLKQMPYENRYTIEVLALTGLIRFHDGEFVRQYPDESDFN